MFIEQDILRQASVNALSRSKKKALLASLDEFTEQMPSLLEIDHPCARRQITDARQIVEVCESSKFVLNCLYNMLSCCMNYFVGIFLLDLCSNSI